MRRMHPMKSTISRTSYNWLTKSGPPTIVEANEHTIPRIAIPIPDDFGAGYFSSIQLPLDIVVRRACYKFKPEVTGRLFPLANISEEYTEPVLIVQAIKTGRLITYDSGYGEEYILSAADSFFRHINKLDAQTKLDTSENFDVTVLIVGDSVLSDLLGEGQAASLLETLRIMAIPSAVVARLPRHISAILHASFPEHLTGNLSKLFAQAKVLEYICALTEHLAGIGIEENQQETGRLKKLRHLHDEIESLEGKVPTLDELARQYGMSARVLNDEFRKIYGSSIFTYISDLRLNEAHEALLKTTVPMKYLAMNMGYSHVNHFISAFGKKFGYSPGSLRRKP